MGKYGIYVVLVALLGVMWYMSNRSRKQQAKSVEFRNNLKPGDEVMTHSGLLGTVVDVEGDTITLESAPGSQSRWIRAAIAKLIEPTTAVSDVDDEADDEDGDYEDEDYEDDIEVPDDLSSLDHATGEDEPEDGPKK
jgi:preprotein translocase subunit YajC